MKNWIRRLTVCTVLSIAVFLSMSASSVSAAITFASGFEFGNTIEWSSVSGSPSVVDDSGGITPKSGDYMLECDTTSATAYVTNSGANIKQITVYLWIDTAPGADITIIGSTTGSRVVLTTDRYIDFYDVAGKGDDGTTQLELDTWNRISMSSDAGGPGGDGTSVWLNGTSELFDTTASLFSEQIGVCESTTAILYFDDCASGDVADTYEDLGDKRVLRAMPTGNGYNNDYDVNTGYTYIDEFPFSDADYIEDEGADAARELFNIEDYATIGIGASDTINAVTSWIRGDRDGGGATDHMAAVYDNSTEYLSADLDFDSIAWYSWLHPDLPNGGGAWSLSRYNSFQVGAYHSGAQDQRVHSVTAMVVYTPVGGASPDISNTPSSKSYGVVQPSTTNWSAGAEPTWPLVDGDAHFTVTNNSGAAVDISVSCTNFTGGVGWTLTSGSPGSNTVRVSVFEEGDGSGDGLILTTSPQSFIAALADAADVDWEMKLETGTFTDGAVKTCTVTLSAVLS